MRRPPPRPAGNGYAWGTSSYCYNIRVTKRLRTTTPGRNKMANPRLTKVYVAVALALGAGASIQAQAQQVRERVEVTGSNIKRIEGETALPVTVMTRADIERIGATSTEDLL